MCRSSECNDRIAEHIMHIVSKLSRCGHMIKNGLSVRIHNVPIQSRARWGRERSRGHPKSWLWDSTARSDMKQTESANSQKRLRALSTLPTRNVEEPQNKCKYVHPIRKISFFECHDRRSLLQQFRPGGFRDSTLLIPGLDAEVVQGVVHLLPVA